jgi:hypothetical protein
MSADARPTDVDRMAIARASLIFQGYREGPDGIWQGKHYHARIDTSRPFEDHGRVELAGYVIDYFTPGK